MPRGAPARRCWPHGTGRRCAAGILLAVGTGNNGGDGWVLARTLHRHNLPVWVAALPGDPSPLNAQARRLALADGVRELSPDSPWPAVTLAVDAVLGTGATGAPRAPAAALLERLRDLRVPIVALDGPTGVDLLNGAAWGTAGASLSITFGAPRRGHLLARDEVGDIVVVDIGLPAPDPDWPVLMTDALAAEWLHAIRRARAQGQSRTGGGGRWPAGMSGALRLSARGAFAAGAGLVFAVAPAATTAVLAEAEPDLQLRTQSFDQPPGEELLALVDAADAVVVGPGLGREPDRLRLVDALLRRARAAVLDADGLFAFHGGLPRLRESPATGTSCSPRIQANSARSFQRWRVHWIPTPGERQRPPPPSRARRSCSRASRVSWPGAACPPGPSPRGIRGWPLEAAATSSPASVARCSARGCSPHRPLRWRHRRSDAPATSRRGATLPAPCARWT